MDNTASKEKVLQQLLELFGNTLDYESIKSMAVNCNYDADATSNQLIELILRDEDNAKQIVDSSECKNVSNSEIKDIHLPALCGKPTSGLSPMRSSKKKSEIMQSIMDILDGYKVLVILRGMPGSGKSYLAKDILEKTIGYDSNTKNHILSTDDFFMKNGIYIHRSELLSEAHSWNQQRAFRMVSNGFSPVIIDNTNTRMWEMKAYATMAIDFGYIIKILEPDTHWCFNANELSKRNVHNVSKQEIYNMIDRYEKNISPQKLLSAYNLKYTLQKIPQIRSYPPLLSVDTHDFKKYKCDTENIENLMDFNETNIRQAPNSEKTEVIEISDDSSSDENLVDKIFTIKENCLPHITLQPQLSSLKHSERMKVYPDIETAWGINEESLRSWDIVTPLTNESIREKKILKEDASLLAKKIDCAVYTEDNIFQVMQNFSPSLLQQYKIINTFNRNINQYTMEKSVLVPKKTLIDKSCSTDEIFDDAEIHLERLKMLFPNISSKHLKYWYDKCKGDIDCTIELILSEKEENLMLNFHKDVSINDEDSTIDTTNINIEYCDVNEINTFSGGKVELQKSLDLKSSKEKHRIHVQKQKSGTQTSKIHDKLKTEESMNNNENELCSIDSDIDVDDIYVDNGTDENKNTNVNCSEAQVQTVELNLGDNFVSQLENYFGDPNFIYPKGMQPVVQLPVTLAKQLYTFYIESVYQQMDAQRNVLDALVKEDEEFAKKLQDNEQNIDSNNSKETTSGYEEPFQEQTRVTRKEKSSRHQVLSPDFIMVNLIHDKLFKSFPDIKKEVLIEILEAHNNKYSDAVATLVASIGNESIVSFTDNIKKPPIDEDTLSEMQRYWDRFKDLESNTPEEYIHEATYYRGEANRLLQQRKELYEKAQQYYQRGMKEVAEYYSKLAAQQTKKVDNANSIAATAFLDEHSKKLQDFNTIDLHYLFVKEAISALDVFLDRNINLLRLSSSKVTECLQIITGRGKRSENGQSKIKPVVIAHLNKRNIRFIQMNPGLLKVKIYKNSLVTSELKL